MSDDIEKEFWIQLTWARYLYGSWDSATRAFLTEIVLARHFAKDLPKSTP